MSPETVAIDLFDMVLLPDGRRGTVVEVFHTPPGYMVEVVNEDGETEALVTLSPDEADTGRWDYLFSITPPELLEEWSNRIRYGT